ncbi:MAG: hypothetical protein AAGA80_21765, partial [Cyanobacteria bacterium P01_F01_bin.143]
IVIEEGATEATFTLTGIADDELEGEETDTLNLLPGAGFTIDPTQSSVTTTITDLPIATSADISQVIFGTTEVNVIEINSISQIALPGTLNNIIDTSIDSEGGNLIYASSGDDTLI